MQPSFLLPANDPWLLLNKFTAARIALGRTGVSIPLRENLSFRLAHAFARDAVYTTLDTAELAEAFKSLKFPFYCCAARPLIAANTCKDLIWAGDWMIVPFQHSLNMQGLMISA